MSEEKHWSKVVSYTLIIQLWTIFVGYKWIIATLEHNVSLHIQMRNKTHGTWQIRME